MKGLPIGTEIKLPFTTLKVEEYSPFTQMCLYCKPNNTTTVSNIGNRTNNIVSEKELRENRKTE